MRGVWFRPIWVIRGKFWGLPPATGPYLKFSAEWNCYLTTCYCSSLRNSSIWTLGIGGHLSFGGDGGFRPFRMFLLVLVLILLSLVLFSWFHSSATWSKYWLLDIRVVGYGYHSNVLTHLAIEKFESNSVILIFFKDIIFLRLLYKKQYYITSCVL